MLVRPPAAQQRVRDVMSLEAASVTPETPLSEVIGKLIEQGVKLLSVVNEQRQVVGVITLGSLLAQDQTYPHVALQRASNADLLMQHLRQVFKAQKLARDVMIQQPIVVKDDVGIETALRWMIFQRITRMPVVDQDGRLVGIFDQESILHYYTGLANKLDPVLSSPENAPPPTALRTVGEARITQVPLVSLDTPLTEVLQQIQSTPLRRVIVVNQKGVAQGVIADGDLLVSRGVMSRRNPLLAFTGRFSLSFPEELFRRRSSSGPLSAQQVMRPHLYAVTLTTPVAEAVRLMMAHQIKRLVIVDEQGKPLGLVERQHILRSLLEGGSFSL
jgi:predicted transcriptional regulator